MDQRVFYTILRNCIHHLGQECNGQYVEFIIFHTWPERARHSMYCLGLVYNIRIIQIACDIYKTYNQPSKQEFC